MLSLFGGTVASLWAASCSSGTLEAGRQVGDGPLGRGGDGEAGRVGGLEPVKQIGWSSLGRLEARLGQPAITQDMRRQTYGRAACRGGG